MTLKTTPIPMKSLMEQHKIQQPDEAGFANFKTLLSNQGDAKSFEESGVMGHASAVDVIRFDVAEVALQAIDYHNADIKTPTTHKVWVSSEIHGAEALDRDISVADEASQISNSVKGEASVALIPSGVGLDRGFADTIKSTGEVSALTSKLAANTSPSNAVESANISTENAAIDGADAADEAPRAKSSQLAQNLRLQSNPVFVAVHVLENGLKLQARVKTLSADEKAELLQRAEALFAEYGLKLIETSVEDATSLAAKHSGGQA